MRSHKHVAPDWRIFAGGTLVLVAIGITILPTRYFVHDHLSQELRSARVAHPELAWAIDEYHKCDTGQDHYAERGYVARPQCRMAVEYLAKQKGQDISPIASLLQ